MGVKQTEDRAVIDKITASQQTALTDHGFKGGEGVHIPESGIQDSNPDPPAGISLTVQQVDIHLQDLLGGNPVLKIRRRFEGAARIAPRKGRAGTRAMQIRVSMQWCQRKVSPGPYGTVPHPH